MEQIAQIVILPIVLGVVAYFIKLAMDFKKLKLKNEVTQKLLDRFKDVNDLNVFLQSNTGAEFLRMMTVDPNPPKEKLISTIYRGIVLIFGGAGAWIIGGIIPEYQWICNAAGVVLVFLGFGFLVSWYIAYNLSKKLGLIDKMI